MKKHFLYGVLAAIFCLLIIAAKPAGITQVTSLWVGDSTDTADVTPGVNDLFVSGTAEIDGAARFDGATALNGSLSGSNVLDEDAMTSNSATAVATQQSVKAYVDRLKRTTIQLASVFVDGTGPITAASAPNLATTDNVGAITYDNSGETSEIQFTYMPTNSFAGLQVNVIANSSVAAGSQQALDWSVFVYADDAAIGTVIAQTGASFSSTSLDTSGELMTLTLDATGIAAVTGGTSRMHIALWNNGTSNGTLEIKNIDLLEL